MASEVAPRPRSGWRWVVVIVVAVITIGLAVKQPIWLTPPSFASTPLVYMLLAFLWIPVAIILHPNRSLNIRRLGVILIILCTLGSLAGVFVQDTAVLFSGNQCSQQALPDGQIDYTCKLKNFSGGTYEFIGSPNAPFVQRVTPNK